MKTFGRQWFINNSLEWDGFSVHILEDDKKKIVTSIVMTVGERTNGEYYSPPMILSEDEVQQIMDQLWQCGVRPRNGEGSNAQINAMKNHLDDMRKIAFNGLKIK